MAQIVRFMSNVMTGVPSIVMGLFIFTIWVLHFGLSGFAGALALGCLMLPIVIRSSEEMRLLVPNSLREGSFALGATQVPGDLDGSVASGDRWHCQRRIAGRGPGGRNGAFALHHPHGDSDKLEPVQGPNTALPSQIFVNATQPYTGAQARAWGAALTLVVIAFIAMLIARFSTARFTKNSR